MNTKMYCFKFKRGTFKFLLFAFIGLIVSCNNLNDNKIVDFELEKRIALPLPQKVINSKKLYTYPYTVKFIENKHQLLVRFYNFNYLFIYDLKTSKIVNKIHFSNRFNFDNVEYINKDSIVLFLSGVEKYHYDTSIVVINNKGEIKRTYGLVHEDILSSSTCDLKHLNKQTYFSYLFPSFCFDNVCYKNRVFFFLNCTQEKFLENTFLKVLGFYDFNQNKVYLNEHLTYPIQKPISVFNYPDNILKASINILPEKNDLMLSFAFSPSVYKLNLENDKGEYVHLDSKLVDTSWVYQEGKVGHVYRYGKVYFVKSLNKYVRFVTRSLNDKRVHSLVTYDDQFHYLGEIITNSPLISNNEIFYVADIEHDSLIINQYKPKEIVFDSIKLENEIKKIPKPSQENESCNFVQNKSTNSKNVLDYIKNKNLKLDSVFSVLILNENGCTSCNEYFIQFIKVNSFLLNKKKNPFYCIYIANKKEDIEQYFKKNKIENIIVDEPGNYNTYHPFNYFNPRLILVKNNKIVSDTIYMPDQLETLLERLLDFYGFEAE